MSGDVTEACSRRLGSGAATWKLCQPSCVLVEETSMSWHSAERRFARPEMPATGMQTLLSWQESAHEHSQMQFLYQNPYKIQGLSRPIPQIIEAQFKALLPVYHSTAYCLSVIGRTVCHRTGDRTSHKLSSAMDNFKASSDTTSVWELVNHGTLWLSAYFLLLTHLLSYSLTYLWTRHAEWNCQQYGPSDWIWFDQKSGNKAVQRRIHTIENSTMPLCRNYIKLLLLAVNHLWWAARLRLPRHQASATQQQAKYGLGQKRYEYSSMSNSTVLLKSFIVIVSNGSNQTMHIEIKHHLRESLPSQRGFVSLNILLTHSRSCKVIRVNDTLE